MSVGTSVRPSVRIELGSHWTDFHEILYLGIFPKSVDKIQVSLKSNKNNGNIGTKCNSLTQQFIRISTAIDCYI